MVGEEQVTMPEFLYLLTTDVGNINKGNTTPIELKPVRNPTSPSEKLATGLIPKAEYLNLANRIKSYIDTNGRVPNYATTSLGKMRYESQIYMFSKILNYYNVNQRLPNTVSVITAPPTSIMGETSYGFVQKIGPLGTGTNRVAIILGVHPPEKNIHSAMYDAIKALASTLNKVKIYIYRIVLYDNTNTTLSRAQGENLTNKFVVPNINTNYKLATDVHGNLGYIINGKKTTKDYIFAPSNRSASQNYANKILSKSNGALTYYYIDGTSLSKVTIPIAHKGIPAVVFELYQNNTQSQLIEKCKIVVKAINAIFA